MSQTVGDFIVQRLHQWGVRRIFGYPGDGINGIMAALDRQQAKVRFVQTRHEELAAFMACAQAKFTGQPGVCLATSGPGAIHLLTGLYDAKKDNMPVVALLGQQARTALGTEYQQEIDLLSLFKDVAGRYVHMATTPVSLRHLVDQAVRIAWAERTVTGIIVPNDLQGETMPDSPREHGVSFSGVGYSRPRMIPYQDDLRRAAEILNQGERVAILVGAGALGAADEIEQVAERLGAGVAKALLGKTVLPDDLPYVTGSIGLLGTRPSWDLMMECDTLLIVGSNFPYAEFLPPEGQAKAVQIDVKSHRLGLRYPIHVNLHADAAETLKLLLPELLYKEDRRWRQQVESSVSAWWKGLESRAQDEADPINPQRVFWELSRQLPEKTILTCDSGSSVIWYARDIKVRRGMMGSVSGGLASMGCAVPYAIAAKLAHPERPVVALVGDGSMQMNGLNGLITLAALWKGWADPRFVVLVLNNGDLNFVTWEQRVMEGEPMFEDSQLLPPMNYADYARQLGLEGLRVESSDQIEGAWRQAFASQRPVLLDVLTDPNVPPLPPHITLDQATSFGKAILKGDSESWSTVVQSMKSKLSEYSEQVKDAVRTER